jgi:phenylalanine-4-hydroxylase
MDIPVVELDSDHPGFRDEEYRQRRNHIAHLAAVAGDSGEIQTVEYTATENGTWTAVFDRLTALYPTHACAEFNAIFAELGYARDSIPQLAEVSAFLGRKTGFRLQPVSGLVTARDFLGALADRRFCATQYIRHSSQPFYTPEPDVVHELMGHAPMLAIPEFADLSQSFGEGSIGASDEQVDQLATLYWFTVEYGVLQRDDRLAAYGAGLLSSFGELEHAIGGSVEVRPFDPEVAKDTAYPITTFQPLLFGVPSIDEAFSRMDRFVRAMPGREAPHGCKSRMRRDLRRRKSLK